jgi:hypothetical protein
MEFAACAISGDLEFRSLIGTVAVDVIGDAGLRAHKTESTSVRQLLIGSAMGWTGPANEQLVHTLASDAAVPPGKAAENPIEESIGPRQWRADDSRGLWIVS